MYTKAALHSRRAPVYPDYDFRWPPWRRSSPPAPIFRRAQLRLGLDPDAHVTLCWIDGLVSARMLTEDVIRPLTSLSRLPDGDSARQSLLRILAGAVYNCSARSRETTDEAVEDLTHGCCVLLFERGTGGEL